MKFTLEDIKEFFKHNLKIDLKNIKMISTNKEMYLIPKITNKSILCCQLNSNLIDYNYN